ncbi:hypothetical protein BT63DRAFT_427052 [Microthyrium microscopicum]|uniref:Uncharacterized protein n=1 Tax=Microthyrium microscopicum TaxID=703497 RepID=A0A6A6U6N7_9PEZI|nr:hypothetical protein BT63DRAFT_427052 [Microthyrium microscopicum]
MQLSLFAGVALLLGSMAAAQGPGAPKLRCINGIIPTINDGGGACPPGNINQCFGDKCTMIRSCGPRNACYNTTSSAVCCGPG